MAQTPEELRAEIESTRQDLGRNVDALNERVSPSRIVSRRVDRTRTAATSLKERIMGSAGADTSSAADSVGGIGSSVTGTVSSGSAMARRQTQGNPLAAGLVAFSAGWLVSSILPATKAEGQATESLRSKAQEMAGPIKEQAGNMAQEVTGNLQEPLQEAADSIRQTATQAADAVRSEGSDAASNVSSDAKQTARSVRSSP